MAINNNSSETTNFNSITFSVEIEKKNIVLERNSDWEINITKTSKLFNKRWRNWKIKNHKVIETFEKLEGRTLIREVGPKNKKQTILQLILALRVLNDYNDVLSYHIFKLYVQDIVANFKQKKIELQELKQKLEIAEAINAKLQNKPIDVDLVGGQFLSYAYECNIKNICVKFGNSFCNKNGQRPKSHKTSVPNLAIGFVIYASKEVLQKLNKAIKDRFRLKSWREHIINCTIDELKEFVINYLEVMKFDYKEEDIHQLTKLNIFLSS